MLPFSEQSYKGDNVLIRATGMSTVSVPLHRLAEIIINVTAGNKVCADTQSPVVDAVYVSTRSMSHSARCTEDADD